MYVMIHGHFYQPPRENPWTGEIPRQEGAAPFHDWNERITDQCYGPNGRSRVLDPQGRIVAIMNNYAEISFDFGPTLLHDLERRFPLAYRRVLEADRESARAHGGHGNAIAQAYNHMILPLANYRDKWTQVRWGLRDFEHRFGRPSEGLWLPETACDVETLEVVAQAGVRFLILAPRQARRVRRLGEKGWHAITPESPLDTSRPYRCLTNGAGGPRRPIDVFFYDGPLSVAISFERLLRSSEGLASRFEEAGRGLPERGLVSVATDGEVYGHHEPFGDMCLAHLFLREGPRRGLRFVNPAEMLDLEPPTHEVALEFTETGEGTAWSCAHGVGRWMRDCGCTTGGREGWNQRWRTPLRRGFDAVRDQIQSAFLVRTSPWLRDPWAARDDYLDVLLDPERREEFLARHVTAPPDAATRRMIWTLLEASHQAMLMYTSCAWFFADVSGLEVQQNLGYAARACELARPYLSEPLEPLLLRHLEQARSNLPEWENGAKVYRSLVLPARTGPEHAAARSAFEAALLHRPLNRRAWRYQVRGTCEPMRNGEEKQVGGRVAVTDEQVEQSWSWEFRVTSGPLQQREVRLTPAVDPDASVAGYSADLTLRDLNPEVREEIARSSLRRSLREESDRIGEIYDQAREPMRLLLELGLPVPEVHRNLANHVLGHRAQDLSRSISRSLAPLPASWWTEVAALKEEHDLLGLAFEPDPLASGLSARINVLLDGALEEPDRDRSLEHVAAAYETLAQADRLRLPLPRTGLEPRAYDLVLRFCQELKALTGEPQEEDIAGSDGALIALRKLAGHANLQLEAILQEADKRQAESPSRPAMGGVHRDA